MFMSWWIDGNEKKNPEREEKKMKLKTNQIRTKKSQQHQQQYQNKELSWNIILSKRGKERKSPHGPEHRKK